MSKAVQLNKLKIVMSQRFCVNYRDNNLFPVVHYKRSHCISPPYLTTRIRVTGDVAVAILRSLTYVIRVIW